MSSLPPARIDGEKAFVSPTEKGNIPFWEAAGKGISLAFIFILSTRGLEIRGRIPCTFTSRFVRPKEMRKKIKNTYSKCLWLPN